MTSVRRWSWLPGAAVVVAAAALLLWPLHEEGVTGNALRPSYGDFGWFAYAPVPEHPTTGDLRTAGVRVPQDAVARRREVAAGLAVGGVVLLLGGALLRRPAA
jgi:hypothetical protein